jgi:integrase
MENNPIATLEHLSEKDSVKKVRYLTEDERTRLMAALDEREEEIRNRREGHNQWPQEKELENIPSIESGEFADYLKPLIILCLNTGIRRSAMLSLEWRDINFTEKSILVRADTDKSEKEYYVPFSDLTFETLSIWHRQSKQTSPNDLVFPSPQTGGKMGDCRTSWENLLKRANIQHFRWHDMRHDFASQLVMEGVDLNTVRELMGHANLKMTLRYAHLAPENKLQAIKALDRKNRPVAAQGNSVLSAQ